MTELEVLYLNKFFKQITQRYTEDMKKLEEKVEGRVYTVNLCRPRVIVVLCEVR